MAGKTGKNGHHTGRTCRSPFVRKVRREGILARKVREISENSEDNSAQSQVSTINYSLGKQNRWLMPEAIKSSANPREVVGEEMDFLLVEQRGTQDGRKRRCISVYDSSTRRIRKPRRRYGEAQSLKSDSNQADLEFEVQYPVGKWSWPLNSEVKYYSEKASSKKVSSKNRRGKWCQSRWDRMIEEDEYFSEDEDYDDDVEDGEVYNDENDDNDDLYFEDHSQYTFLGDYIFANQAKQASCIQRQTTDRNTIKQKCTSFKNKVIIIDSEELAAEHQRFVANAKAMNSFILSSLKSKDKDLRNGSRKNPNTKRNRALRHLDILKKEEAQNAKTKDPMIESPKTDEKTLNCTPENYPSCEIGLQGTEIMPSELQRTWGKSYIEGKCIPRKFAIDLAGLMKDSTDIDLAVLVILFELKKPVAMTNGICKASVKFVLHNGLSELNASQETTDLIQRGFVDSLSDCGSETLSVGKIINAGMNSIRKNEIFQGQDSSKASAKKPFYTSNVFAEVLGYQGRSCTEKEVLVQTRKELLKNDESDSKGLCKASSLEVECGICFENLNSEGNLKHTTLVSCGHSFCNPCWELYLKSILNMGETDLLCPGHQCKTPLDDITIMSLATFWFGKYFSWKIKRGIAKNPTLKHCPSEKCPRVMHVTPCRTQKPPATKDPLPVICACKHSWCFKCQQPAHWPSQCEKAQKFREEYKEYQGKRFMGGKTKKKLITSVMVKKCPTCSYPIEKFYGCDHMYCILCESQFCWQCLSTTVGHNYYGCKEKIAKSEVKLPAVSKTKIQTLTDIALFSQNARKVSNIIAVQKRLKAMEQGLNAFCYLKTRTLKNIHHSRITSILEGMIRQGTLMYVKNAFDFKLQAHVVLEGVAIILVKGGKDHDIILQNDLMMLMFIMDGLDDLLKKPCSAYGEEVVSKLTVLIERGKLCIKSIKRHAKV